MAVLFAILLTFSVTSSALADNGTYVFNPTGTASTQSALDVLWYQNSDVTHFAVSLSAGFPDIYYTGIIPQTIPPGSIIGNHTIPQSIMASLIPGKEYRITVKTLVANDLGGFDLAKTAIDNIKFIAQ